MQKVILIKKCEDCKYVNCKLRLKVGLIPQNCPLVDVDNVLSEEVIKAQKFFDENN